MTSKYQTLSGFLLSPFHTKGDLQKDTTYDSKYRSLVQSNGITLHAVCVVEDSYYFHIKIPSESQNGGKYKYDVVIRFFTDSAEVANEKHLRNYYIQFFSNAPSFMYQYAYLYNKEGFLIKALYDKLDADYINVPPEKTNAGMKLMYDKTIYCACRYLSDQRFRYLDKFGMMLAKKKDKSNFFRDISDFKSVKLDQELISEEKKLSRVLDSKSPKARKKPTDDSHRKNASKSTVKGSSTSIFTKKKAGGRITIKPKKSAAKTTYKK